MHQTFRRAKPNVIHKKYSNEFNSFGREIDCMDREVFNVFQHRKESIADAAANIEEYDAVWKLFYCASNHLSELSMNIMPIFEEIRCVMLIKQVPILSSLFL